MSENRTETIGRNWALGMLGRHSLSGSGVVHVQKCTPHCPLQYSWVGLADSSPLPHRLYPLLLPHPPRSHPSPGKGWGSHSEPEKHSSASPGLLSHKSSLGPTPQAINSRAGQVFPSFQSDQMWKFSPGLMLSYDTAMTHSSFLLHRPRYRHLSLGFERLWDKALDPRPHGVILVLSKDH